MSRRQTTQKKTRRRRRQSKAEHFFGAVVIEGLGVLAIIITFVFARQASEPSVPSLAEAQAIPAERAYSETPNYQSVEWRTPDSNRFQHSWSQANIVSPAR